LSGGDAKKNYYFPFALSEQGLQFYSLVTSTAYRLDDFHVCPFPVTFF